MQEGENKEGNWSFRQEGGAAPQSSTGDVPVGNQAPVQWTASEFIDRQKDGRWYSLLALGFAALAIVIYLVTKDIMSIIFIGVAIVLFSIIAAKKPRQRLYEINNQGIFIDQKFYNYGEFKSFSVAYEGAIGSIIFMPLKRFMPELTIYFAPPDENKIVNTLLNNLPFEERTDRTIDKLAKKLHF